MYESITTSPASFALSVVDHLMFDYASVIAGISFREALLVNALLPPYSSHHAFTPYSSLSMILIRVYAWDSSLRLREGCLFSSLSLFFLLVYTLRTVNLVSISCVPFSTAPLI